MHRSRADGFVDVSSVFTVSCKLVCIAGKLNHSKHFPFLVKLREAAEKWRCDMHTCCRPPRYSFSLKSLSCGGSGRWNHLLLARSKHFRSLPLILRVTLQTANSIRPGSALLWWPAMLSLKCHIWSQKHYRRTRGVKKKPQAGKRESDKFRAAHYLVDPGLELIFHSQEQIWRGKKKGRESLSDTLTHLAIIMKYGADTIDLRGREWQRWKCTRCSRCELLLCYRHD